MLKMKMRPTLYPAVSRDTLGQNWVMHYQRTRFAQVKRVALKWLDFALLYGLAVGVIEVLGLMRRGWAMWLFVPFTMVVIWHYYVGDPGLRDLLPARQP